MVACPLCHGNLDIRQKEIKEAYGAPDSTLFGSIFGSDLPLSTTSEDRRDLPIFYITQLAALAMGVASQSLGFESVIIDPKPLLRDKQLL
jgi:heterodisulfide reductase subunit B